MASKLDKCATRVNDEFAGKLGAAFKAKFARELETNFNIFSMQLISAPVDGEDFTQEQKDWVTAYSDGYGEAMGLVRDAAWQDSQKRA